MSRPRSHRSAFSLIEAIAAISLLALAVPALLWSLAQSRRSLVQPTSYTTARWLVTERLEDVLADASSPARGYAYVASSNYPAESPVSGFSGFSRSMAVAETGANLSSAGTGWKTVTVIVAWTDVQGDSQSLAASAVVTQVSP